MTVDVKLIELEQRWHEADDTSRAARAELAAGRLSAAQSLAISTRIEQADRLKKSIIKKIESLEENSLAN